MDNDLWVEDRLRTERNRERLKKNKNLLYWYQELYRLQFSGIRDIEHKVVLEIGSGTSPLKLFYPRVLTSDCMDLDYLDYRLDFCRIDEYPLIPKESLDVITMTNVLHHLRTPVEALIKAREKLKKGGIIIMAEPYYSTVSHIIYRFFHPEPSDFSGKTSALKDVHGPLLSANMAIPFRLFFKEKGWADALRQYYDFSAQKSFYYTGLSYMVTGGISHNFHIPEAVYRRLFKIDKVLAYKFPKIISSFFIIRLMRK